MAIKTVALLYCDRLHIGGVETHLLALLRHASAKRRRWIIVASVSQLFRDRAEALGAQIVPWKPNHAMDPLALVRLLCILKKNQVNILHTHSARGSVFGQIAAFFLRIPVIVTFHQPLCAFAFENGSMGDWRRWLRVYLTIAKLLNRFFTHRIIHVSSRANKEAFEAGLAPLDKTVVIRNGVDVSKFARKKPKNDIRKKLNVSKEVLVIVCIGRLHDQKGFDIFFNSLKLIESKLDNIQVWIAGDGVKGFHLKRQARELKIERNIRFLGFRSDISDILHAGDLYVLPSRFETGPISVLEAMSAGLPCVVTDVGENYHFIEQGISGIIVPPEDPHALSEAIKAVLSDPVIRRKMGNKARKRASLFSEKQMARCVEIEYEKC